MKDWNTSATFTLTKRNHHQDPFVRHSSLENKMNKISVTSQLTIVDFTGTIMEKISARSKNQLLSSDLTAAHRTKYTLGL